MATGKTTDQQAWKELSATTRLNLVNGRISGAENTLYNMHLSDLEKQPVNEDERTRLQNALAAFKTERDSVQAEIDANPPAPPTP